MSGFESLVVGSENALAVAIAYRVVAAPGACTLNPFVIEGASGSGKTALIEAIAAELAMVKPGATVALLSARSLLDRYIGALQGGMLELFRREMMNLDVLLLDECEQWVGKRDLQIELRGIIDGLLKSGRQVVLATAEPLHDLQSDVFDVGLHGRLCSGVTVQLSPPGEDFCDKVVRKMLQEMMVVIANPIVSQIVEQGKGNLWTLAGCVRSEIAKAAV